jgi:hypothetical protein
VVPTGSSHGRLLFAGRFFDQQRADSSLIRLSDYPEPPLIAKVDAKNDQRIMQTVGTIGSTSLTSIGKPITRYLHH